MAKVYYTGKPCKKGHLADRYTPSRQCVICAKESQQKRRASPEGRAKHLAKVQEWQANNPEKVKAYKDKYFKENKEHIYEKLAAYYKANPEKRKAVVKAYTQNNKDRMCAKTRNRQLKKLQATPSWADKEGLRILYEQCDYISRLSMEPHQVDHIVPIRNSSVCGLHVPWNLQIITATENRRKGNIFQGKR